MTAKRNDGSIRNHAIFGLLIVFGLLGGLGTWAAMAEISGAVIAPGRIAVDSNAKKVQHPEGGVVARLEVREGAHVGAGDLLIVLDDTILRADLAIVSKALDELGAQQARLVAERDGLDEVAFPLELENAARSNPDARDSIEGQRIIFESRKRAHETAETQLSEQIAQLESLIEGLTAQRAAREEELTLIGTELEGVRELYERKLVPLPRLVALDRDRTRIAGESGKLVSDIATARGSIAEKRVEIVRLNDDFHSEVVSELAEVRNKINENAERKIAATVRLSRIEIRAPVSGKVHQLSVFTVGGVISAGEVAMLIVPEDDQLVVDAQIEPREIEELRIGQKAVVRFSAFADPNLRDGAGEVTMISPDLLTDEKTGRAYYQVKLSVDAPSGANGTALKLVPGMPVETFITKGDRTVLAYLTRPVRDQMQRIFRE
ncbi:HlyD family type I secretion periplasmic adaptor subunit [Mesorhizobium sp. L-8-10]|uniref:HlyD family type I secretion periplasmic adaptor subunit n=1 Tax=Mesorhizobium sp. L-8-10 TaxID=2744523 RepID=UPI0019260844|nr:HlyD family type I secretion periplasmic adaptor subunit [Mesorhizobium sp. L-8-10]